ncbi:MAG: tetratricopeptide repeat protein [Bacteroidales bacterium]
MKNKTLKYFLTTCFITAMLLLCNTSLFSNTDVKKLALEANSAYNLRQYDSAANLYAQIINSGYESAELYFNLGNTYYRLNNIPEAILYYEKSLQLNPRNKDAAFNLNIANEQIQDKVEKLPELFYVKWFNKLTTMFSINTFAILTLVFLVLSFIGVFVFLMAKTMNWRKVGFFSTLAFVVLFTSSLLLGLTQHKNLLKHDNAIIFTPTINVKSSPNDDSKDIFVLHEGTKVKLLDNLNDWYEIQLKDGNKGWLKKENFRVI